ncbi:diacylglycerol kinase family protein [Taibaiella lutea]|nr:diacylglycerol kinase family protein [Taibaiella lutea]
MKKLFKYHFKSFGYAFTGIKTLFATEHNMLIHLMATIIAIASGWYRGFNTIKWCILIGIIAMVWMAEAFNTAIERLCNKVQTEYHPVIKQVKDISSAAVLICAIAAVIIGIILFFSPS